MLVRLLPVGLVGLLACAQNATRSGAVRAVGQDDDAARAAVFAAAAESVFVVIARPRPVDGVLLAEDSATARALESTARGAGLTVRVIEEPAWCARSETGTGSRRLVGTANRLTLDSLRFNRAVVRWTATCLLESPSHTAPFVGGQSGALEVVRQGDGWRVSRSLYSMAL